MVPEWLNKLAETVASQGPLFAGMVGFIYLLAAGRLLWKRELERCDKVLAEEKAENVKLRETVASLAVTAGATITKVERLMERLERQQDRS